MGTVVGRKTTKRKGLYTLGKCARTMSCARPQKSGTTINDNLNLLHHTRATTTTIINTTTTTTTMLTNVAMSQPTTTTANFKVCIFLLYSYFTLLTDYTDIYKFKLIKCFLFLLNVFSHLDSTYIALLNSQKAKRSAVPLLR